MCITVQPMATRCLFNPTFRAASELVQVCISANAAISRTLGVSAYLKQLDRFIQVEVKPVGDKALARQKFNLIAAVLDRELPLRDHDFIKLDPYSSL